MTTTPDLLERIAIRLDPMGGKAVIRDTPISVERVLKMMSEGETEQSILDRHESLEPEDIQACLLFAYRRVSGEEVYDRLATLPPL